MPLELGPCCYCGSEALKMSPGRPIKDGHTSVCMEDSCCASYYWEPDGTVTLRCGGPYGVKPIPGGEGRCYGLAAPEVEARQKAYGNG